MPAGEAEQGAGGRPVSLMTLHASKGLEFSTVFIAGMVSPASRATKPRDAALYRRLTRIRLARRCSAYR